jgi:hypothetical protein
MSAIESSLPRLPLECPFRVISRHWRVDQRWSYDIDARVKAILQKGLSVYRVDAEKLQALRADIIVTQDHCEVCAKPESMAVVEMPVPRPGAGEVLVRLRRSGQHDWVRKC